MAHRYQRIRSWRWQRAAPMMTDGGSIVAMTYYGAEKVVPHYNVMGVAKATLEASTRYLAYDLGPKKIRVNCIWAGPVRPWPRAGSPDLPHAEALSGARAAEAQLRPGRAGRDGSFFRQPRRQRGHHRASNFRRWRVRSNGHVAVPVAPGSWTSDVCSAGVSEKLRVEVMVEGDPAAYRGGCAPRNRARRRSLRIALPYANNEAAFWRSGCRTLKLQHGRRSIRRSRLTENLSRCVRTRVRLPTNDSGEHARPACGVRRLGEQRFSGETPEIARGDACAPQK